MLMHFKKYWIICKKKKKMWVDKESQFYNRSLKSWLEKNDIELFSIHIEGKSIVA